jgi:hypothetical protein
VLTHTQSSLSINCLPFHSSAGGVVGGSVRRRRLLVACVVGSRAETDVFLRGHGRYCALLIHSCVDVHSFVWTFIHSYVDVHSFVWTFIRVDVYPCDFYLYDLHSCDVYLHCDARSYDAHSYDARSYDAHSCAATFICVGVSLFIRV